MNLFKYSSFILRIGLGLIFLYFSIQQMMNPEAWASFVPQWIEENIVSANKAVIFNSIFELCFGILLILGLYTRVTALLLGIHLLVISFSIGFNPVGVRDFGLAIASLSLALREKDKYSLDYYFYVKKKHS